MSKYTTELRFICETEAGETESKGYSSIDEILTASAPNIFSFNFPIFDETYRLTLEKKILKHYYTREICEETYGLWKLRLDSVMNEIMPYYNKLYSNELQVIGYNPLADVDLSRTHTLDKTEDKSSNTANNFNSHSETDEDLVNHDLFSDTPQGALDNLESGTYLTNARKVENDNHVETDANGSSTTGVADHITSLDSYVEHVAGRNGLKSYSKEISEFRKTFLNIDMMIINDLKDLFFNLY